MTWEEFVRVVLSEYPTAEVRDDRITPQTCRTRRKFWEDRFSFWKDGTVADRPDDRELWIAWGRYCETLKAEMDRCNGSGVCSRPIKVEVKG